MIGSFDFSRISVRISRGERFMNLNSLVGDVQHEGVILYRQIGLFPSHIFTDSVENFVTFLVVGVDPDYRRSLRRANDEGLDVFARHQVYDCQIAI